MNNKSIRYTFYSIRDTFQFGKNKDLSLEEVILSDSSYIDWCISNISEFSISQNTLNEIKDFFPNYIIPRSINEHIIDDEYDHNVDTDFYEVEHSNNYYEQHYDIYQGTWAQEVEGYSDEDIDTIFDGDPNAYWNID